MTRCILSCLLLVSLLTGCEYDVPQQIAGAEIASWRDFDQDHFTVTVTDTTITVNDGVTRYVKNGKWANRTFTCDTSDARGVAVAMERADDSLVVQMVDLNPQESRMVTCTKTYRGLRDEQVFPPGYSFGPINYPPPKGLFREGMLEADMKTLPWQSGNVDIKGEDSEIGPDIYHYQSDDPNLPELLVTVYKGRVTDVDGGAEGTSGPSFYDTHPIGAPVPSTIPAKPPDPGWAGWLFNLIFSK